MGSRCRRQSASLSLCHRLGRSILTPNPADACRVEGCLLTCPLVADAAVIGVWSEEKATEFPRAYSASSPLILLPFALPPSIPLTRNSPPVLPVVPKPEHAKSPTLQRDVAAFVASKLAPHKRLGGGVVVIDEIPKRCVLLLPHEQSGKGHAADPSIVVPSASGKILRKDLRALAAKEAQGKAKL